jgi:creatinine amidohydrolase
MSKANLYKHHRDVRIFDELTWPDVSAAIKAKAPIMVPLGATEQHGLHLPLGSDTMQGIEIAKRAAFRLADENIPLVVGPAIAFGPRPFLSESPKDFPGTVNITNETLKVLTEEICSELIGHGFGTIYLLIANAESDAVAQLVAKDLTERTEADVMTLNWLVGIRPNYKALMNSTEPQGHGGEGETARMLATAPHLAQMNKARPFHLNLPKQSAIHGDYLPYLGGAVGRYRLSEATFAGFEDGITGDPQLATAEQGEKVYGLVIDWLTDIIRNDWSAAKTGGAVAKARE